MKNHTHRTGDGCSAGDFKEWLVHIAPDYLWFDVQDVGDYSGSVYGMALYQGKIALYEDYYGSCSGCGAWGEGGEPSNQGEVVKKSTLFGLKDCDRAIDYIKGKWLESYEKPDSAKLFSALKKIAEYSVGSDPEEIAGLIMMIEGELPLNSQQLS